MNSRLEILQIIRERGKKTRAICKCQCGRIKNLVLSQVKRGDVKSCGCLKREITRLNGFKNRKHGQASPSTRTRTYRSWEAMKSRCLNPKDPSFGQYGGRGITVCDRWMSFENFLADMGNRPVKTTLDRINNDGDYTPTNCRWAIATIQQRNKRNNQVIEFQGETIPLVKLAEKTGIPYQRLWERICQRGWAVKDAINKPVDVRKITNFKQ